MVTVRHEGSEEPPHLAGVAESGGGRGPEPGAEHELELSPNLPQLTQGGFAGILVAIVRTIVASPPTR